MSLSGCGDGDGSAAPVPMRVVGIDTANAPQVSLTVIPPPSLQGAPLPEDAFEVHQDGEVLPAQVERLDPASMEVAAILDVSGAEPESLRDVKGAAIEFLLSLPDRVRFSVVATTAVRVDVTKTDIATAMATIDAVEAAPGGDLGAAVTAATLGFTPAPSIAHHVVIFSATSEAIGDETVSAVSEALRRESAVGHVVGWSSVDRARRLSAVPEATGGSAELVDDGTAVGDAGARMAGGIANQYRLEFVSSASGSTDIELQVRHRDVEATASIAVSLPEPDTTSVVVEAEAAVTTEPPTTEPPTTEPPTTEAAVAETTEPETSERETAERQPAQRRSPERGLSPTLLIVMAALVVLLIGAVVAGFIVTARGDSSSPEPLEPEGGQT